MSGLESDLQQELDLSFEESHEHRIGKWDVGEAVRMIGLAIGAMVVGPMIGDYATLVVGPMLLAFGLVQAGQYKATLRDGHLVYEKRRNA